MIEEYVPHDQRHDGFNECFLDQRFGKWNNFIEPLAENSIPFPIRQPRHLLHTSVIVSQVVTQELVHLKFSRRLYLLLLHTYHNIHRRRCMNNHQFRRTADRLLRYNNFCEAVERLYQKNQNSTDLSQLTPILNRLFVLSLARVINSSWQQFAVAISSLTFSFSRNFHSYFFFFVFNVKGLTVTNSTLIACGRSLTFGTIWHCTQFSWLRFTGAIRHILSVCSSHLFSNLHFNGISSVNVNFKST